MENTSKKTDAGLNFASIIGSLGIIAWLISDFYGGMIIHLFSYFYAIAFIVVLYITSLAETLVNWLRKGTQYVKVRVIVHLIVFLSFIAFNIHNSEILRSERVLTATLRDDLFHYTLVFRKNGKVETHENGFLGYSQVHFGKYRLEEGLIIFDEKPYDNDFIPDSVLLDLEENAIFITKDSCNKFSREKVWLNHFEIDSIDATFFNRQ
ncbi:MAG: hypothetical protein HWE21_10665 [Cytophagia bacterium]|nr:hypothetical protein [Cytophagia bacterium]